MSRVFVLGNASLDTILRVQRLPQPGETLIASAITRTPGGKGFNQAAVIARAGVPTHFCAALGNEPEAERIWVAAHAEHFAALHFIDVGQPTDLSTILVAPDAENVIISTGACAEALSPATADDFVNPMTEDDILLVQGNLSEVATRAAAQNSVRVVFNAAPLRWPPEHVIAHCNVVIANQIEAEQITGLSNPAQAAQALGAPINIVTLGAKGCIVADATGLTAYPAVKTQAIDTTGAGDTFTAVFTAALARRLPIARAIEAAQYAAALTVERAGCYAALPTKDELEIILAK